MADLGAAIDKNFAVHLPWIDRLFGTYYMPSRHIDYFRCNTACVLYVASDAAFDIHYVDGDDKEISPDDALNAVGQTAVKPPAN